MQFNTKTMATSISSHKRITYTHTYTHTHTEKREHFLLLTDLEGVAPSPANSGLTCQEPGNYTPVLHMQHTAEEGGGLTSVRKMQEHYVPIQASTKVTIRVPCYAQRSPICLAKCNSGQN